MTLRLRDGRRAVGGPVGPGRDLSPLLVLATGLAVLTACAADAAPPLPNMDLDGGRSHVGSVSKPESVPEYTDTTFPCEGLAYTELEDGDVFSYYLQLHSENADVISVIAGNQMPVGQLLDEVLQEYSCVELLAEDVTTLEQTLREALEEYYEERRGEPGVIDALALHPGSCN